MADRGLGKGLGALLGDAALQTQEGGSVFLPITQIETRAKQPRKQFDEVTLAELAESIRQHGILQPLTVRRLSSGYYQIVAGERRWRAARIAGLSEVPVIIIEADDRKATELALIENLQREDLNAIEEAAGFKALIEEYGLTQEEASVRVGRSRPAITNALRLLSLSGGHARALLQLKTAKEQESAARSVIDGEMSVRQTETLVKRINQKHEENNADTKFQPVNYLGDIEKSLAASLGRRIKIVSGRKKGRLEIEFYGDEDFERLIDVLTSINR